MDHPVAQRASKVPEVSSGRAKVTVKHPLMFVFLEASEQLKDLTPGELLSKKTFWQRDVASDEFLCMTVIRNVSTAAIVVTSEMFRWFQNSIQRFRTTTTKDFCLAIRWKSYLLNKSSIYGIATTGVYRNMRFPCFHRLRVIYVRLATSCYGPPH